MSHAVILSFAVIGSSPSIESKRGNYTIWFDSPHISDITSAYRHHGYSARKAVKFLKRSAPDDRYARLTHSTLTSWFDNVDKWKLHPRFQLQFDNAAAAVQYAGHASALSRSSEVEEEIKRLLVLMRNAGAPINTRVVKWVMTAVIDEKCPDIHNFTKLSQPSISRWVRYLLTV